MPLNDRDQAIAVAEAHVRAAGVGEPQLLGAEHVSDREPMRDSAEHRLRALGATDAQLEKMKEIWCNRKARHRWEVRFLLYDSRYTDGITIGFVKIDDATGEIALDVFQRGGPTVA